jgi:cytochrome b561
VTADNVRSHLASAVVLTAGLLGLVYENVRALFGVLLWACVVARFYRRVRQPRPLLPDDMRNLVRGLSRSVYLLLYVLIFFRIVIGIVRAAPHRAIFGPVEDFQSYLAYGLISLATIHALAALCRHFGIQDVRAPWRHLLPKRPAKVA